MSVRVVVDGGGQIWEHSYGRSEFGFDGVAFSLWSRWRDTALRMPICTMWPRFTESVLRAARTKIPTADHVEVFIDFRKLGSHGATEPLPAFRYTTQGDSYEINPAFAPTTNEFVDRFGYHDSDANRGELIRDCQEDIALAKADSHG